MEIGEVSLRVPLCFSGRQLLAVLWNILTLEDFLDKAQSILLTLKMLGDNFSDHICRNIPFKISKESQNLSSLATLFYR